MSWFDRFTDRIADWWSSAPWFGMCAIFVLGWTAGLVVTRQWNDPAYHLWLNSPTTALTFLGMFALHNTQHRFEKAQNERWAAVFAHLGIADPVDDEGQKP